MRGWWADGKLDFSQSYAPEALRQMDAGKPIKVFWPACIPAATKLFAREPINSITDLKGRTVGCSGRD